MSQLKSYDIFQIMKMLPHRYPFLLLDSAYDVEPGVKGFGTKLVTVNEWFFPGHFPNEPIMPGVLIIECLAQLTAVVYISKYHEDNHSSADSGEGGQEDVSQKVGYLLKSDIKFVKKVTPGDKLVLYSETVRKMTNLSQVKVIAKVDGSIVAEGILNVSEK